MRTFGKIIVSGEYAAGVGRPALTMPASQSIIVTLMPSTKIDLSEDVAWMHTVEKRYEDYLSSKCEIEDVLRDPEDLSRFTIIKFLDYFKLDKTFILNKESCIPIGSGMGSSAALIVCIIKALANFYGIPANPNILIPFATQIESLQHGHSSGIDIYSCWYNQCLYFKGGIIKLISPMPFTYSIIQTGKPVSTTGACMTEVRKNFPNTHATWDQFESVTEKIYAAWLNKDLSLFCEGIVENQRLLELIGVVPEEITKEIQDNNLIAKICGAGSIEGDSAGIMLQIHR